MHVSPRSPVNQWSPSARGPRTERPQDVADPRSAKQPAPQPEPSPARPITTATPPSKAGDIIAALCINVDLSGLQQARGILDGLLLPTAAAASQPDEDIGKDLVAVMDAMVAQAIEEVGKPVSAGLTPRSTRASAAPDPFRPRSVRRYGARSALACLTAARSDLRVPSAPCGRRSGAPPAWRPRPSPAVADSGHARGVLARRR